MGIQVNCIVDSVGWARHFIINNLKEGLKKYSDIEFVLNNKTDLDLNLAMYKGNLSKYDSKKTILFLDSFRAFNINLEVEMEEIKKELNISHILYPYEWSWGLTSKELFEKLKEYNVNIEFHNIISDKSIDKDLVLVQTTGLLKAMHNTELMNKLYKKLIIRLGGNKLIKHTNTYVRKYLKNSNLIIATNKKLYMFGKAFNKRTKLIPNGFDLNKWYYLDKKFNSNKLVGGFAGNISNSYYYHYKGFDYVTQAFKISNTELKLALFGTGQIKYEDMLEKFYKEIDFLILPTVGEGCSNVISEALACGVPVLTTRLAGFHGEVLKDRENVIFIERNINDIAEKIKYLNENRELLRKIAINGRKFAEQYHDINKIAKKYYKVLMDSYYNSINR